MRKKKIVLVTSSQPSLNPRMVKEADLLAQNGYEVVVVGQYWNEWATEADKTLLPTKKWKFICVGGSPLHDRHLYFASRLIHKIARKIRGKSILKYGIAELSIGRCTYQLYREAIKQSGDLYIGHNPGGLAPAVLAAKHHKVKCGFDAEDFHRREYSDDPLHPDVACKEYLEEKYFPRTDYLTTASPLISEEYSVIFPKLRFNTILNVFGRTTVGSSLELHLTEPLKLFWFSQTIGPNRGLDVVIEAIRMSNSSLIELHVLGNPRQQAILNYQELAQQYQFRPSQLNFYSPIPPDQIFDLASRFDIGLATEIGVPYNRKICLTNKIFTYIQSGLAVIASNTPAQKQLFSQFPGCGIIFDMQDVSSLAAILTHYLNNRDDLSRSKSQSFAYGQQRLNWENEGEKFLEIIQTTLTN